MASKSGNRKSKWVLISVLTLYVIELVWFFYSQIVSKLLNGQPIEFESKELAIILVLGLLAIVVFFVLKKSKKIGGILITILVGSVILFGIIAPLLDVYIPVIWKILSGFRKDTDFISIFFHLLLNCCFFSEKVYDRLR